MSITDSGAIRDLFQVSAPLFTQREAAELSGLDAKAISNWIDRGIIKLEMVNGRRQSGRRLFSRYQVLLFKIVAACQEQGMAPSDAMALAIHAYIEAKNALDRGKLIFHVAGNPLPFLLWLIVKGKTLPPDESSKSGSGVAWTYSPAVSPLHHLMFSEPDGQAFKLDADLSHKALILLPLASLVHDVAADVAALLAAETEGETE